MDFLNKGLTSFFVFSTLDIVTEKGSTVLSLLFHTADKGLTSAKNSPIFLGKKRF